MLTKPSNGLQGSQIQYIYATKTINELKKMFFGDVILRNDKNLE